MVPKAVLGGWEEVQYCSTVLSDGFLQLQKTQKRHKRAPVLAPIVTPCLLCVFSVIYNEWRCCCVIKGNPAEMRAGMFNSGIYMHYFDIFISSYRHNLSISCKCLVLRRYMCMFDGKREMGGMGVDPLLGCCYKRQSHQNLITHSLHI